MERRVLAVPAAFFCLVVSLVASLVPAGCGSSQDLVDGGAHVPDAPVIIPDVPLVPSPDGTPIIPGSDAAIVVDPPFTGVAGTIIFVTQVPVSGFATVTSAFGNHTADMQAVPRGGDLMLRYPDGTIRNLTHEAGFGMTGMQGANAIAVREPSVHWSGNKALFSMVIGAPTQQFQVATYTWQIYEVTGLARGETAVITKVPAQPEGFNNVAPFYGTDDRVLFISDRPRGGESYLYPQLDEYESAETTAGIYSLDPTSGDLFLLDHAPSGDFSPSIDSAGRVVFIRWDHLQRDQQADEDRVTPTYGSFTYSDESAAATKITSLTGMEVYPEPRDVNDPDYSPEIALHTFNQFFPWQVNEDGTEEETLNHVGRHELGGTYSDGRYTADPNLTYLVPQADHANTFYMGGDGGLVHFREDPTQPGMFVATFVPEFATASTGQLLRLSGGINLNAEQMQLIPLTALDPDAPDTQLQDRYRNPVVISDGTLVASHTLSAGEIVNSGTTAAPSYNAALRLMALTPQGGTYVPGALLTTGPTVSLSWYDPDTLVTFQGALWELDAAEVAPRTRPARRVPTLDAPEASVFSDEGVDPAALQAWLADRDLALIVSRDVTARDRADVFQPFNLAVPGGAQTIADPGTIYDVSYLQIFEADALRGYGGVDTPRAGRRLLARPMHGPDLLAPPTGAPSASVAIAADGSIAALVPAQRALSWQLTSADGDGVVLERNWITVQPGEIRTCPACHGVNTADQIGRPAPDNAPQALRQFLQEWHAANP